MDTALVFMQWDNYEAAPEKPLLFCDAPLTFNSRQERLHKLCPGDRLWLVSRCPADQQYYFVAVLSVAALKRNGLGGPECRFGEFAVIGYRATIHKLGKRFPAEPVLRALQFESGKPIKYGASIGQALQTLRLLTTDDGVVLDRQLARVLSEKEADL